MIKRKLKEYRNSPVSLLLYILVALATMVTVGITLAIIIYILIKGVPHLNADIFSWKYTSDNASMMPAIINTLYMTVLALLFAVPAGIGAAIYLVEYAPKGNRFVDLIRLTTETLQGIPSIVYGLFGFLMFSVYLGFGYSLLGGALTLAIMILPLIMRTAEEALLSVPDTYREGSYGLGAGKLRTVFRIILPTAVPGILSGIILAVGRVAGETAALLYTAGSAAKVAGSFMDSSRTLSVHMYVLLSEGLYTNQAFATAVVLLLMVVIINAASGFIAKKFSNRK